ncbi:hypothetical protein [Pseudophaeobacter sp. C1-32P7]|uniref:hypothetical protein n=1 Tax=Pseudophaeobacter sp. C1-32P7 TaxID=3098142 RepID=UPI0034D4DD85
MAQSVEDTLLVRMEASLRKFERQMEGGRKAAESSAVRSERAWKRAGDKITANSNRAASGLQRLSSVGGQGRFVLQNTANQIGDIAVQMQGGTSASRALGQQLPQLFGGFAALGGPLGLIGPLLGTVAALGLPVAGVLINIGDAAETLDDKMKSLKESISAVKSAQELSATSGTDLLKNYGDLADEARAIFEINRQIASIRASSALTDVGQKFGGKIGVKGLFGVPPEEVRELEEAVASYERELEGLNQAYKKSDQEFAKADRRIDEINAKLASLREVRGSIGDIAEMFGVTADQARELAAQIAAAGAAQGADQQAQAWSDVSTYLEAVVGTEREATDEGKRFREQIVEVAIKALQLSKIDLASGISAGADQAERLKEELAAALALQNRINFQDSKEYSGRGGDPRRVGNDDYTSDLNYKSIDDIISDLTKSRGGGSSVSKGLREAQRLYDDTRTEAERYAAELERIERLHREFPEVITTEVRDRAVEALNDAAGAAEGMAKRLESGFTNAFTALVTGAGSGREAVQALIADLARMAAQSAFKSLIGGSDFFGEAASFLFGGANANGNVFQGGSVTPFANGGVVGGPTFFPMAGGRTGLMGEDGAEAIMPLARVNGKLGVKAAGGNGASGRVLVDVRLTDDLDARIDTRAEGVATRVTRSGIQQYDRSVLPQSFRQLQKDPRKVR